MSKIAIKKLGKDPSASEQLALLMLVMECSHLVDSPNEWMANSKMLRIIFNGTMNSINAPALIAEDVSDYEEAVKQDQRNRAGLKNGEQNLKMKLWAKVYYLSVEKEGHRTSKDVIAKKIRDLLIKAGYPPSDVDSIASDGKVPTERTIETKWLAHLK